MSFQKDHAFVFFQFMLFTIFTFHNVILSSNDVSRGGIGDSNACIFFQKIQLSAFEQYNMSPMTRNPYQCGSTFRFEVNRAELRH